MGRQFARYDDVKKLLSLGYSPLTISLSLSIPIDKVQSLAPEYPIITDKELDSAMKVLAWRAWQEAMRMLDIGSPQMKMHIIKSVFARTMSLASPLGQKDDAFADAFTKLLARMNEPTVSLDVKEVEDNLIEFDDES